MKIITNGFRFRVGVSLALGLIWTSAAAGDGPLFPGAQYAAGDGPMSVAIGDLDGDQVPDLAVANLGSDNVSVLLGVGDGTFVAAVNYAAGHEPWSVAIGDLNGDRVPDLAVANYWSDKISVLLGLGDGTFVAAVHYAAGSRPVSVAIGDLNGDQAPDLAVANYGTYSAYHHGSVSVLLGVGDGTFAAAMHYVAGDAPWSVAIGDLDGDQVPDLAVANVGTNPEYDGKVSVLLNQSSMSGDIDGDDDVDLSDFALFAGCMTGPLKRPYPEGCDPFDFDGDLDVDFADLAGFQRAFGPIP